MANICLDSFLNTKEKRLVDLDWLNVSEEDYNNLPFDPVPHYIAEPKLVKEWSHEEDSKSLNLVPNSNLNFNSAQDNSRFGLVYITFTTIKSKNLIKKNGNNNIIKLIILIFQNGDILNG